MEVASLQGQIAESPEGLEKAGGTSNPFEKFSSAHSKCQEIDELKSGVRQLKVNGLVLWYQFILVSLMLHFAAVPGVTRYNKAFSYLFPMMCVRYLRRLRSRL